MDVPVELRQLRYFVAVADELHFGRAAERLHMSQSPLSRAIRELERELGVVLFIRTTRRVELTPAGSALLERTRRALAEIDGAIADTRRVGRPDSGTVAVGYGPFGRVAAERLATELAAQPGDRPVRLEEEVTQEALRRITARELTGALVMEIPTTARQYRVRPGSRRSRQHRGDSSAVRCAPSGTRRPSANQEMPPRTRRARRSPGCRARLVARAPCRRTSRPA